MGKVNFIGEFSVDAKGNEVLNSLIKSFIDESDIKQFEKNTLNDMYFTKVQATSLDEVFTSKSGDIELPLRHENGLFEEMPVAKKANKSYKIKEFGGKRSTTKLAKEWTNVTALLTVADSNVKRAFEAFKDGGKSLLNGANMTLNIEAIKLIAEGFAVTSDFGPGSPTPGGVSLFGTHTVDNGKTVKTFKNVLSTANGALAATTLEEMINIHRTKLLMGNGYRVPGADVYELWVSRDLAGTARKLLNTAGDQAGIYSGTGVNSAQLNIFNFKGAKVVIKELDYLGGTDSNGVAIGLPTMYFLVNPTLLKRIEGFRYITLYTPEITTYVEDSTKLTVVDCALGVALDHYGAECAIVGSKGTV